MSEFINNASKRQVALKELIRKIHKGLPLEAAKKIFKAEFDSVTTDEIIQMEQSLIDEGMTIEEVQGLCDVHAAVFDGSISDIHKPKSISETPGHPVQIFMEENKRAILLIEEEITPYLKEDSKTSRLMLHIGIERLKEIDKHYQRKENLFFPVLEKKGNDTIPKVMWGVDNEIRLDFKKVLSLFRDTTVSFDLLVQEIKALLERVKDMITKEDNILMPLLMDTLKMFDWILIDKESDDFGYFLDIKIYDWASQKISNDEISKEEDTINLNNISFDAGALSSTEVNAILNTLPLDITFVDKLGHVKYFSQGNERIFPRPKTIIGRHVNMCHPPQSVHIVEGIIKSFENNEKDHEDFWIQMGEMFVYIRYFAIRDQEQNFLGTLEVTQNIKPIRALEGEKRIVEKGE